MVSETMQRWEGKWLLTPWGKQIFPELVQILSCNVHNLFIKGFRRGSLLFYLNTHTLLPFKLMNILYTPYCSFPFPLSTHLKIKKLSHISTLFNTVLLGLRVCTIINQTLSWFLEMQFSILFYYKQYRSKHPNTSSCPHVKSCCQKNVLEVKLLS